MITIALQPSRARTVFVIGGSPAPATFLLGAAIAIALKKRTGDR